MDTPQNLYDRPTNVFVAGFIGSPAMNFFPAKLAGSADEVFVEMDSMRLGVPDEQGKRLKDHLGEDVIFGIRPEDLRDKAFVRSMEGKAPVSARVDVTELMGSEVFVYLSKDERNFIARVDPRTAARPGGEIELAFDMTNMHLFDAQTEKSLAVT